MKSFEDSDEVNDYFNSLLPQIELLSIDEIPFEATFIGAAGFEDRCFSFINQVEKSKKKFINTIGIEYRPLNKKNKKKEFEEVLDKITLKGPSWLIYDRFDPEKFYKYFIESKNDIWETANVVIDISGMSKFLIIVILNLLEEYIGNIHIIYSEAEVYHPTEKEFKTIKKDLPENTPSFLTKDVYKIITTSALSSINMQGYPLVVVAFPTFNHKELVALLTEITPQYLIKIEGIPHEKGNLWRLEAIHWINRKIDKSFFYDIDEIIHQDATTFDYVELVKILDKIYKNFRYTHKCIIAPTGSKLQTFGVFIFKQMHPEVQIIYPVTKEFAEEYSKGHTNIWHIPIIYFFDFMNKLNQHRKYKVKSLKSKIGITEKHFKYILHISDIHLGTISEARKYLTQLETDLIKNLKVIKLDYLVISGDVANFSTHEEYEAAVELIKEIINRFRLDSNCIIIVPGNHDINWSLSEDAYEFTKNEILDHLPEGKFIPAGDTGVLLRNEELYKQRFFNFNEFFYKETIGTSYPLNYNNQSILYENSEDKILFLGINSCWEIDHYEAHNDRASINMEALSNVLSRLMDNKYDNWFKIAVWHHPVSGPEMMKNVEFMQQLADHGFQICMHGHIHEASESIYKYDDKRGIHIVGAGTFGAPKREQVIGIPLQYNLLVLDTEKSQIIVNTRKKEKPDGAWAADARWGDKNNPKPRYKIDLR